MLIPWQSYHGAYACTPGLAAVSGGDGTDSVLELILLDMCGLLQLRPFVPGSYGHHFLRHGVGNAYPFVGSPGCVSLGTRVPSLGRRERLGGQSSGEILTAHINRKVEKQWHGLLLGLILFKLVAPPLQSGVVVSFFWYGVYGSLAVCRWSEPVVSRILGHNR
jgi:hypothetical protein